jgi:DNA-binding transcriptional MerR regulator
LSLISKKDLLAITGISYGQLYRWKRERLIPEEWFIKQSAYTGQETFFPRDQILSRIKSILDLKDLYSLEELAKILSPETSVAKISRTDLQEVSEINQELLSIMDEIFGEDGFEFIEVALTAAISQAMIKIGLSAKQAQELLRNSSSAALSQKTTNISCTVFYTGEDYHTVFSPNSIPLAFDGGIEVLEQLSLSEIADTLKMKYKNLFINKR